MPLDENLLEKARHNERFLATLDLDTTPYLDWAVTIAFYAALRYVDAFFYPERPHDHRERLIWVQTNPRTRPIYDSYLELYLQSRDARYELTQFTPDQVKSLVVNSLGHIRAHMLRQ